MQCHVVINMHATAIAPTEGAYLESLPFLANGR